MRRSSLGQAIAIPLEPTVDGLVVSTHLSLLSLAQHRCQVRRPLDRASRPTSVGTPTTDRYERPCEPVRSDFSRTPKISRRSGDRLEEFRSRSKPHAPDRSSAFVGERSRPRSLPPSRPPSRGHRLRTRQRVDREPGVEVGVPERRCLTAFAAASNSRQVHKSMASRSTERTRRACNFKLSRLARSGSGTSSETDVPSVRVASATTRIAGRRRASASPPTSASWSTQAAPTSAAVFDSSAPAGRPSPSGPPAEREPIGCRSRRS